MQNDRYTQQTHTGVKKDGTAFSRLAAGWSLDETFLFFLKTYLNGVSATRRSSVIIS